MRRTGFGLFDRGGITLRLMAIAAVLALSLTGCHSSHIDATVENRTGAPIELLEVDYPSASFGADRTCGWGRLSLPLSGAAAADR